MHVYRWDLDKTYLETDFDSLRGLVRSATEPASAKRAVPGAAALLRAISGQPGSRVFILSGSPVQMRRTLEEKLALDGVTFESLTLKDQLALLRKGEFRAIKGQFGYKLPHLMEARAGLGTAVQETLFGDDAEVDALVYSVYADVVAGRISGRSLSRIMEAAGAYPDDIRLAQRTLRRLSTAEAVSRIFIRVERGVPERRFQALGGRVIAIHSWFQAALVLARDGRVAPATIGEVADMVMVRRDRDLWQLAALAQDLVRRGHLTSDEVDGLALPGALGEAVVEALSRLGPTPQPRPFRPDAGIDYLALVRAWRKGARPKAG